MLLRFLILTLSDFETKKSFLFVRISLKFFFNFLAATSVFMNKIFIFFAPFPHERPVQTAAARKFHFRSGVPFGAVRALRTKFCVLDKFEWINMNYL